MSETTAMSFYESLDAIFISHATEDADFVRTLAGQLRRKRFEVWHQKEMAVGGIYTEEIDARLDRCKAGIVVWSRASVSSEYVIAEANRLRERKRLVPVYIEECKPPIVFNLIHGVKCNNRSLSEDDLRNLSEAINRLNGIDNLVLNNTNKYSGMVIVEAVRRNLSQLHGPSIIFGNICGALICYFIFAWYYFVPTAYMDEFKKNVGTVTALKARPTLESEFPEPKPILYAMAHSGEDKWALLIVDSWNSYYEIQKTFADIYCHHANTIKRLLRHEIRKSVPSEKADSIGKQNLKIDQTLETIQKKGTAEASAGPGDFNHEMLDSLKPSHCPGGEESSSRGEQDLENWLER